jgi:hypothetical protein
MPVSWITDAAKNPDRGLPRLQIGLNAYRSTPIRACLQLKQAKAAPHNTHSQLGAAVGYVSPTGRSAR